MSTARLVPASGRSILDPRTRKPLPPEGADVELGAYWHRRLADGDVKRKDDPKTAAPKRATQQTSQE